MAVVYKIHPAIGAARVGNSAEYYLAPETPGGQPLDCNTGQPIYTGPGVPPQNIYHDASGALKKQGARFKVFAYDNANPADPGTRVQAGTTKVNGKTVTAIEWTVYLANKKASWFQFEQLTGSGMEGDLGYKKNNANNPGNKNSNLPFNALRSNVSLGISSDPNTINDPSRRQLVLDPGPRTVSGPKAPAQEFALASKGLQPFNVTTLGRILTDADCNLIVLAGDGCSGTTDLPPTIDKYANNSGWFDDVSDGPVTGVLVLEDGSKVPIDTPSWVLCGPPKYAPEITNLVTLYDTMYDVFVQHFGLNPGLFNNGFQASYQPSQASEIVPLLSRPNLYHYVAATGSFGTSQHAALPTQPPQQFAGSLQMVRAPGQTNTRPNAMPLLAGDNPTISDFQVSNFLTLTATQFFVLQQYAHGIFSQSAAPTPGEGVALDRANLENCVGGAFCPGIEMTWISRNTTIYMPLPANPAMSDAFRIKHKNLSGGLTLTNGDDNDYSAGLEPGDIIKYMAQPWQADFNECSAQPVPPNDNPPPPPPPPSYWWWPAQRPFSVFPAHDPSQQVFWTRTSQNPTGYEFDEDLQMVTNWKDMGFILNIGPAGSPNFVEIERNEKAIDDYGEPLTA
jgi:L-Lysine epsilon oxidase N-terminal/L-lysine epsilon oxidase C-terminal domain